METEKTKKLGEGGDFGEIKSSVLLCSKRGKACEGDLSVIKGILSGFKLKICKHMREKAPLLKAGKTIILCQQFLQTAFFIFGMTSALLPSISHKWLCFAV